MGRNEAKCYYQSFKILCDYYTMCASICVRGCIELYLVVLSLRRMLQLRSLLGTSLLTVPSPSLLLRQVDVAPSGSSSAIWQLSAWVWLLEWISSTKWELRQPSGCSFRSSVVPTVVAPPSAPTAAAPLVPTVATPSAPTSAALLLLRLFNWGCLSAALYLRPVLCSSQLPLQLQAFSAAPSFLRSGSFSAVIRSGSTTVV